MVEVPVRYSRAVAIVVIEYLAVALLAGSLALLRLDHLAVAVSAGSLAYLFTGAALIGRWVRFDNGTPVGVGNGVLIQAVQIPIIIPVLIVGSFLYDLLG